MCINAASNQNSPKLSELPELLWQSACKTSQISSQHNCKRVLQEEIFCVHAVCGIKQIEI